MYPKVVIRRAQNDRRAMNVDAGIQQLVYLGVADKAVAWVASAQRDIRSFPADARRNAGFELRRVQQGLDPDDWKPMSTIVPGVREIRIHTGLEHRVFYVATFADAVYVLHAFEKRTRKTTKRDLDLARDRFRALVTERRTHAQ
jgi:phage-related protein